MRLIDADALIEMLNRHEKDCNPDHFDGHETFIDKIDAHDSYGEWQFANGFNLGIVASIVDAEHAPTADAVEIVRCKDCRYYGNPFGLSAGADSERWCFLLGLVGAFDEEDYCSHGERKTAESE